jgi:hypothetical protein
VVKGFCQPCQIGFWGTGGTCTACPAGYTTRTEGSFRQSDCVRI